jgi:hypothetical protein
LPLINLIDVKLELDINLFLIPMPIPIFPLSHCNEFMQSSDVTFRWFKTQNNRPGIPIYSKGTLKYKNLPLLLQTGNVPITCEIHENGYPPQYQCESQLFEDLQTLINQLVQPTTPLTLQKTDDGAHVVLLEMPRTNFMESEKIQIETSIPVAHLPSKFKCKGNLIFQTKLIDLRGKISIKLIVVKGEATLIQSPSTQLRTQTQFNFTDIDSE